MFIFRQSAFTTPYILNFVEILITYFEWPVIFKNDAISQMKARYSRAFTAPLSFHRLPIVVKMRTATSANRGPLRQVSCSTILSLSEHFNGGEADRTVSGVARLGHQVLVLYHITELNPEVQTECLWCTEPFLLQRLDVRIGDYGLYNVCPSWCTCPRTLCWPCFPSKHWKKNWRASFKSFVWNLRCSWAEKERNELLCVCLTRKTLLYQTELNKGTSKTTENEPLASIRDDCMVSNINCLSQGYSKSSVDCSMR